jgi:hypothetical protein
MAAALAAEVRSTEAKGIGKAPFLLMPKGTSIYLEAQSKRQLKNTKPALYEKALKKNK